MFTADIYSTIGEEKGDKWAKGIKRLRRFINGRN